MAWPNFEPRFTDPSSPDDNISLLLDPCHMLKLIRGTLYNYKEIKNFKGNK